MLTKRDVPRDRIFIPESKNDDLRKKENCLRLLQDNSIDVVIHLAAIMGGVGFTSKFPATQYYNNILMDVQLVEAAREAGTKKIVLVCSSCSG